MGIYTNTSEISRHTVLNAKLVPDSAHLGSGEVSGLSGIEASKQLAAWTAVDRHIKSEHRVVGIGSGESILCLWITPEIHASVGSTVPYVVERIIAQGQEANKDRVFIPTGFQSKELIVKGNLVLGDVDQFPSIDVTIDGADELRTITTALGITGSKGGACHLREKVLAEAAESFIIVADYRKKSVVLGTSWKHGVPIEVVPFAYVKVLRNLNRLGSPTAALRMAKAKAGPVVSDNGNFIIDAPFDEQYMKHPLELLSQIKMLTGVVEVGLFCNVAKVAYFGEEVWRCSQIRPLRFLVSFFPPQDGSVTVRALD
ncbi:hypothetical protein BS47DRAFT_1361073 [Hydnum rufescens UP504]|uniref:Ribose-5-phosphate isomerase n=1 Tax=Hydnum rufescens UP504 TaxID=1448309 RepID=A0A9P6B2Z3_9AGAM|nr:hypothetical protein BS47DRAFT_1361073 [Hydnum rufescens UP504]